MKLTPETIQQLAAHRIKPLGAPERTIQRAQRLVMGKVGKGILNLFLKRLAFTC